MDILNFDFFSLTASASAQEWPWVREPDKTSPALRAESATTCRRPVEMKFPAGKNKTWSCDDARLGEWVRPGRESIEL